MFKNAVLANYIDFSKSPRLVKDKIGGLSSLVIVGIIALLPTYSNAGEPPKIWSYNRSFAIDSCQESIAKNGDKILKDCNFFVRNYADAMIEVYDKDNKLVQFFILNGARPSTSVFEHVVYAPYSTGKQTINMIFKNTSEYSWNDFRYDTGTPAAKRSEKTTPKVPIVIPKGGKMVVTQSSLYASAANAWSISLTWMKRFAPEKVANLMHEYMKEYPEALIDLAIQYSIAYNKLEAEGAIDVQEAVIEFEKITTEAILNDITKMSDVEFQNFLKGAKITDFKGLAETITFFKGVLGSLGVYKEVAEIVAESLGTAGQIWDVNKARKANDNTITYNNYDSLQPTNRFPDLADYYYQDLYELELAGFTLSAKNWNKPFQPEIFGANDRLNKNEFLRMMGEIMKRAGYPIPPSDSIYSHPYYDLYRQLSDSESATLSNVTVYSLLDKALNLAFGDNYALCVGTDSAKAFMRVKKGEDFFKNGYHNFIKQLYMAGIVLTNTLPTDGTVYISLVTREESLHWYISLHNAMTKGKAKGCGV